MNDDRHVMVMGPCQSGKVTPRLYNFVTHIEEAVDLKHLTDEQAVNYLPDSPVIRGCYHLMRARGYGVLEALTALLMGHLVSGGQRRVVPQRHGGM